MNIIISPEILSLYHTLIQNPKILSKGDIELEKAQEKYPNFFIESSRLFVLSSESFEFRKNVGVLFLVQIRNIWDIKDSKLLTQKQKKEIRETLLHGILLNAGNLKIIEIIALLLGELICKDGFDMWASPLLEFISWMNTNELPIIATGLELFLNIFNKLDNRVTNIIPNLMLTLFQIFAVPELTEELREKVLILVYMCISSFAYADGVNNTLVHQCFDETYELWISLFISTLQTSIKKNLGIKRFILKIFSVIFRDFTHYSKKSLQIALQPIWKFFNQFMPLYVMNTIHDIPLENLDENMKFENKKDIKFEYKNKKEIKYKKSYNPPEFYYLDEDLEFNSEIEALSLQLIELISTIILKPNLYIIAKLGLFPIINTITHFLMLSKSQSKISRTDQSQYISDEEDETTMRSMRSMLLKLISELIEKYGEETIQILIVIAEKFMVDFDETRSLKLSDSFFERLNFSDFKSFDIDREKMHFFFKSSNFDSHLQKDSWKKQEVSLLLLGAFSDDIIVFQTKYNSAFNLAALVQNLMGVIEKKDSHPILKARVLWTISKFSEILGVKHRELFLPLFALASRCMEKRNEITVKIMACKSVALFGSKIERFKMIETNESLMDFEKQIDDDNLIQNIFLLLDSIHEEGLRFVLESFITLSKISSRSLRKVAQFGGNLLLNVFNLYHNDLILGKLILQLIRLLCTDSKAFSFIYNAFMSYILEKFKMFQEKLTLNGQTDLKENSNINDVAIAANLMDIICVFLREGSYSEINESLVVLINPLINVMLLNEDVTLQLHASICLKTFIIHRKEQILKLNLINDIIKVINKISHPMTVESSALYLGNLIMLTFNNLSNGIADMNILKALVYKVYKSRMPSIVQGLALVFARMINFNTKETLKFLTSFSIENRIGLKVLIDKWLLHQPLFKGKFTKNATILALSKLLLEKDKTLETLLVIGFNPSHSNINSQVCAPFKIMSTLIRCMENENNAPSQMSHQAGDSAEKEYKFPKKYDEGDDDERLDTQGEDDNFEFKDQDEKEDNPIEVDLEKFKDDEELDIEKRFNQNNNQKDRGLADLEVGSECYMTDMLDFEFDDGEECDETTELDLIYLGDQSIKFELKDMLKLFFVDFIKNDSEYFVFCLRNLIKEDVTLLKKYVKIKGL